MEPRSYFNNIALPFMISRVFLLALFLSLLVVPALHAQNWTNLPGPYGMIERMVSDGSTIFASSPYPYSNLYSSTNDGAGWARVDSLPGMGFGALTMRGDTLYTLSAGVTYSVDGAKTWTQMGTPIYGSSLVFKDPYIFVGSGNGPSSQEWDGAVHRSSDNGATWQKMMMGMSGANVVSMAVLGDYVFAMTVEFGKGVWRTSDDGATWQSMKGVGGYLAALHVDGPRIYAIGQSLVFVSLDSGTTWTKGGLGIYGSIKSMASSGDTLIVGTSENVNGGGSLFRSTDGGRNFKKFADGVNTTEFFAVVRHRDQVLAGSNKGIYRSTFGGSGWELKSDGITNIDINTLGFGDGVMYAAGYRGLYSSPDLGRTWRQDDDGLEDQTINVILQNGTGMLLGGEKGIYRTSITGSTWYAMTMTGVSGNKAGVYSLSHVGDAIYAASGGGLLRSTDKGGKWTIVESFPVKSASRIAVQGTDMFVMAGAGLYRSTDAGGSWTKLRDFPSSSTYSIAINGQDVYVLGTSMDRFRSPDYGDTWEELSREGLTYYGKSVWSAALVGSTVYTGTEDGIFRSTDKGATWTRSDSELEGVRVVALAHGPNQLYAGTLGRGIFRSGEVLGVPGRAAEPAIPVRVYPNPLVNEASIEFTLDMPRTVSMSVLDMLGRVVRTIDMGNLAMGKHRVRVERGELRPGTYLYKLHVGEEEYVGRLTVL